MLSPTKSSLVKQSDEQMYLLSNSLTKLNE